MNPVASGTIHGGFHLRPLFLLIFAPVEMRRPWYPSESKDQAALVARRGIDGQWEHRKAHIYFRVPVRSKFTVHFVSSSDRAIVPVIVFPSIFRFTWSVMEAVSVAVPFSQVANTEHCATLFVHS